MNTPKIILICGKKNSGKDVLSDYLVKKYGYYKLSLADALKEMLVDIIQLFYNINIPKRLFYSRSKDKIGYNIEKDGRNRYISIGKKMSVNISSASIDMNHLTLRFMMQIMGSEICKKYFGDNVWCETLNRKIQTMELNNKNVKIVISDCRFANELEYFKEKYNSKSIKIIRNEKKFSSDHISEIVEFKTDDIISNNGTINDLYKSFDRIISVKNINSFDDKMNYIKL